MSGETSIVCPKCNRVFDLYPSGVYNGQTEHVLYPPCGYAFVVRYIIDVEYAEPYPAPEEPSEE